MKHFFLELIQGFYSKLFLFCICSLCIFTMGLSIIIGNIARDYEQEKYLRDYDFALTELHQSFAGKCENFTSLLSPLYHNYGMSETGYRVLSTFYKNGSLSYTQNQLLSSALQNILALDPDLVGILMYSAVNNTWHLYDPMYQNWEPLDYTLDYPDSLPFYTHILSDDTIRSITGGIPSITSPVFGLSGTIYEYSESSIHVLGRLVLLFNAAALDTYQTSYALEPDSYFLITGINDEVYYSSDRHAADVADLLPPTPEHTSRVIKNDASLKSWNGTWYYNAVIYNGRHEFFVQYLTPRSGGNTNYTQRLIFLLALFLCFLSAGLYLLSFSMSARRVRVIKKGMDQIGNNNLTYRIRLPDKGNDEFIQIMSGFNMMCDKLQHNVEQSYISEIKQRRAELKALQTSINPHFLYNTLEMIRAQINQGENRNAAQMVLLLSKIYRSQLGRSTYVSLDNEIEQCENLIVLYQYRFGNFEYNFDIPFDFLGYGLPKNTLQPLIENYFVHGLDSAREDNYLELSAKWIDSNGKKLICLSLSNDGLPISEEAMNELKEKLSQPAFESTQMRGFALSNINDSIRLTFGSEYGLYPEADVDGASFSIKLIFPPVTPDELKEKHGQGSLDPPSRPEAPGN